MPTRRVITTLSVLCLALPLASCMHVLMPGGSHENQTLPPVSVRQESTVGDLTLTISIPPMTVAESGEISVRLRPSPAFADTLTVQCSIVMAADSGGHAHHQEQDAVRPTEFIQEVTMIRGRANLTFAPTIAGPHILTVSILSGGKSNSLSSEFTVHESRSAGMMGLGRLWSIPVIGIVVMGSMMLAMWAIRGGF